MIIYEERNWVSILTRILSGVSLWYTIPPALTSAGIGVAAVYIYDKTKYVFEPTAHNIMGTIISFLLVFRVNQSFSRFSEATQLLMNLYKCARDLLSQFCAYSDGEDAADYRRDMSRLAATTVSLQLDSLRHVDNPQCPLLTPEEADHILGAVSRPMACINLMRQTFYKANTSKVFPDRFVSPLENNFQAFVQALANLDKIRNFPYPFPFAQVTLLFLLCWTMTLPFSLAKGLVWLTPVANFFISLFFWSINDIGIILEDPFGSDLHDLPLSEFALVIERDLTDIVAQFESSKCDIELVAGARVNDSEAKRLRFFGVAMPRLMAAKLHKKKELNINVNPAAQSKSTGAISIQQVVTLTMEHRTQTTTAGDGEMWAVKTPRPGM